jgi:hypothetical protein
VFAVVVPRLREAIENFQLAILNFQFPEGGADTVKTDKIPALVDQAGIAWALASQDPHWHDGEGPIGRWRTVGNYPTGARLAAMEAAEAFVAATDNALDETLRMDDGDRVPVAVQLDQGLVAVYRVRLEVKREFVADFQGVP